MPNAAIVLSNKGKSCTILRQYPEDQILAKLNGELPFAGALLKYWKDYRSYLRTPGEKKK